MRPGDEDNVLPQSLEKREHQGGRKDQGGGLSTTELYRGRQGMRHHRRAGTLQDLIAHGEKPQESAASEALIMWALGSRGTEKLRWRVEEGAQLASAL